MLQGNVEAESVFDNDDALLDFIRESQRYVNPLLVARRRRQTTAVIAAVLSEVVLEA